MTKNFKAATLAATAVALTALLLAYPALVAPAAAQTSTTSTTSSAASTTYAYPGGLGGPGQGPPGRGGQGFGGLQQGAGPGFGQGPRVNVTDGETFPITSSSGQYVVVGDDADNGTASGTITFTVTGSLTDGDTLSISGNVVIAGTTYTISSGSAELNPSATTISGQGATSPTGVFLLQGSAHGSFVGSNGQLSLDLSSGTTEYLVTLTGSISS